MDHKYTYNLYPKRFRFCCCCSKWETNETFEFDKKKNKMIANGRWEWKSKDFLCCFIVFYFGSMKRKTNEWMIGWIGFVFSYQNLNSILFLRIPYCVKSNLLRSGCLSPRWWCWWEWCLSMLVFFFSHFFFYLFVRFFKG